MKEQINKKELTLADRMHFPKLLPDKDSFERLLIREGILEKCIITNEDVKKHSIKTEAGQISWVNDEITYKYEFTETENTYIRECLQDLSKKKELTSNALGLYKQFV